MAARDREQPWGKVRIRDGQGPALRLPSPAVPFRPVSYAEDQMLASDFSAMIHTAAMVQQPHRNE